MAASKTVLSDEPFFINKVSVPESFSELSLPLSSADSALPASAPLEPLLAALKTARSAEQKQAVCQLVKSFCIAGLSQVKVEVPPVPAELMQWLWHTASFDSSSCHAAAEAFGQVCTVVLRAQREALHAAAQGKTEPTPLGGRWSAPIALTRHMGEVLGAAMDAVPGGESSAAEGSEEVRNPSLLGGRHFLIQNDALPRQARDRCNEK